MKTLIVDTKNTIWHRAYYKVEEGTTPQELVELIENHDIEADYTEYLYETVEDLPLEDNHGNPTIEILNEKTEIVWTNQ